MSTQTSNHKSFWAFLLSIFFYMSAFYLFNLSPSSLLSTTKFWFFISNTLILILAADFGTFSSTKEHHDFYQEYTKNTTPDKKILDQPLQYEKETEEKPSEKVVDMVEPEPVKRYENTKPELQLLTVKEEHDHEEDQVFERIGKRDIIVNPKKGILKNRKKSKWSRSESDKAMLTEENREKIVLQRHESYEDNSEFSNMSNEELNKRVEEFILKCNRQIRLQAAKSRQDDGYLEGQNGEIESLTRLYLNT